MNPTQRLANLSFPDRRRFIKVALGAGAMGFARAARGQGASPAFVYVSNEESGDITIVSTVTDEVVAQVPVGKRPRGLKLARDGKSLFIALSGSPRGGPGVDESKLPPADRSADGVGVLDIASRKLLRTLKSGQDPESFDLSLDGKRLFVSNEETAEVSIVDVRAGKVVKRVKVAEEPEGVSLRPDGKVAYVTCEADNRVFVIDTRAGKVIAKPETGARPRAIVFTRDGALAFVSAELDSQVNVLDARAHKVLGAMKMEATPGAPMGPRPMGLVLSPDEKTLYVSNGRGGSVGVVDVTERKLRATWPNIGVRPWGLGLTPDGKKLYTANGPSNDVAVIDTGTGKVIKRVKTGELPWGIAVG